MKTSKWLNFIFKQTESIVHQISSWAILFFCATFVWGWYDEKDVTIHSKIMQLCNWFKTELLLWKTKQKYCSIRYGSNVNRESQCVFYCQTLDQTYLIVPCFVFVFNYISQQTVFKLNIDRSFIQSIRMKIWTTFWSFRAKERRCFIGVLFDPIRT